MPVSDGNTKNLVGLVLELPVPPLGLSIGHLNGIANMSGERRCWALFNELTGYSVLKGKRLCFHVLSQMRGIKCTI